MKKTTIMLAVLAAVIPVTAQDFGYTVSSPMEFRSIGIAVAAGTFEAEGSNPLPDSARIRITSPMAMVEYREMNTRIAVGYQTYDLGGRERTAFAVSAVSGAEFALTGADVKSGVFIPVVISAQFLAAEKTHTGARDFEVGGFGAGTGVKGRLLSGSFGVQGSLIGAIHYASVGFGVEYGSMSSLAAEVQALFPGLLFDGVTAGYRLDLQRWNLSDDVLDYRRTSHGAFVGVFF